MFENVTFGIDLATAGAFLLSGFFSGYLFTKRFSEESSKQQRAALQNKSVDFLFSMDEQLEKYLEVYKALPEPMDEHTLSIEDPKERSLEIGRRAAEQVRILWEVELGIRKIMEKFHLHGDVELIKELDGLLDDCSRALVKYADQINQIGKIDNHLINKMNSLIVRLRREVMKSILDKYIEVGIDRKEQRKMLDEKLKAEELEIANYSKGK